MRLRSVPSALIVGAALFGVGPSAVRADVTATTPLQSASIPQTDTDWGPGTAPNDPLTFTKFNPALGTLQSVNVSLGYSFTHPLVTMTFTTPSTISVFADTQHIQLQRPDQASAIPGLSADVPMFNFPSQTHNSGTFSFSPSQQTPPNSYQPGPPYSQVFAPQTGSTGPVSITDPTLLSQFIATPGSSTVLLPALATARSHFSSNSGNGGGSVETQAGATVTVSYTYSTAVPEPGSVVLLGLGATGLLFVRNARRRLTPR